MPVSPIELTQAKTIIQEIPTTGHSPLKTLCLDGKIFIAKTKKALVPFDYEIVSEFLCSQFLQLWGINTPSFKGVTFTQEIIQNSGLTDRHRWDRNYRNFTCFGSCQLENPIEVSPVLLLDKFRGLSRFEDPFQFFKIALFDLWVVNDDRKPTNPNLLLAQHDNGLAFYAIDHAYTFGTSAYNELSPDLTMSYNDSIMDCSFVSKVVKGSKGQLPDFQAYLHESVNLCQISHAEVLNSVESCLGIEIPGKAELEHFLYNPQRVQQILTDFQAYFT